MDTNCSCAEMLVCETSEKLRHQQCHQHLERSQEEGRKQLIFVMVFKDVKHYLRTTNCVVMVTVLSTDMAPHMLELIYEEMIINPLNYPRHVVFLM